MENLLKIAKDVVLYLVKIPTFKCVVAYVARVSILAFARRSPKSSLLLAQSSRVEALYRSVGDVLSCSNALTRSQETESGQRDETLTLSTSTTH